MIVRILRATLREPAFRDDERQLMPMSTLLDTDEWMIEADWDGRSLGDLVIFHNDNAFENKRRIDHEAQPGPDGAAPPKPFAWRYWGCVPSGQVKGYTLMAPLEMRSNAEPEAKPRKAAKGPAAPSPFEAQDA